MAMSIGDANDVQTVLQYLTGHRHIETESFLAAAGRIADRSTKVLMAGRSGADIRAVLSRRRNLRGFRG